MERKEGDNPGTQPGIRELPEVEDTLDHHDKEPVQGYHNMDGVVVEGSQGPVDVKDRNMAAEEVGIWDHNRVEVEQWEYLHKVEDQKVLSLFRTCKTTTQSSIQYNTIQIYIPYVCMAIVR